MGGASLAGWNASYARDMGNLQDGKDRIIELKSNSPWPNEPVKITAARNKNGAIPLGKIFRQDDDDWLQGLKIAVKNVSNKNVTYILVHILFERSEETNGEPPLLHLLAFGSRAATLGKPGKALIPESSIDLTLPDPSYSVLKRTLRRLGYPPSIKRLQIYVAEVAFDDGTLWSDGYWFRRDPDNPEN